MSPLRASTPSCSQTGSSRTARPESRRVTARRNGVTRIGIYSLLLLVPIGACSDTPRSAVPSRSATEILDELDQTRREREGRTQAEIKAELNGGREAGDEQEAADWFAVTPDNDSRARARRNEAAEEAAESAARARRAERRSGTDGSVAADALPWYEGGTLHAATGRQWLAAGTERLPPSSGRDSGRLHHQDAQ